MQVESLSWFPGHMTKTRRMIAAEIGHMDAVCEILDARIPLASRNPDVDELTAGKPRLVVLNRVDQADPGQTRRWAAYFREKGYAVLEANSYCCMTISLSASVRAAGSPGAATTGSMLSSVKPRSSMVWMSFKKSGFAWVKVPRI